MNNFYNAGAGPEAMMIVRRTHYHAVHVYMKRSTAGAGMVITRIEQSSGRVPDTDGLVGPVFHSPKAIRRAVLIRMRNSIINTEDGGEHDE